MGQTKSTSLPRSNIDPHSTTKSPALYDVIITYSRSDVKTAEILSKSISEYGLKSFLDEIEKQQGEHVIDTKAFILIMSTNSVTNDYCCDQIALAYISNKPIIPLFVEKQDIIKDSLEFSSKLVLKQLEWLDFTDSSLYDQNVKLIVDIVTKEATSLLPDNASLNNSLPIENVSVEHQPVRSRSLMKEEMLKGPSSPTYEFWDSKIGRVERIPWFRFEHAFLKEYEKELSKVFDADDKQISWVIKAIHKDLFNNDEEIEHTKYLEFTGGYKGKDYFFQRIVNFVTEKLAIMEVLSMNSTIRLKAIANLVKYSTPQVLESLFQLTSEEDANVRTIACIAIGKVAKGGVITLNETHISKLMRMVHDKDRLVRESACITLGRLKIYSAVDLLLDRWRNDVIYNVRVAASDALKLMDNENANQAVYLTEQLQMEVKNLSEEAMND